MAWWGRKKTPKSASRRRGTASEVARSINNGSRPYLAASSSGSDGWISVGGGAGASADAVSQISLAALRNRSRHAVRNDPYAARIIQVFSNNAVGTGIRPRAASGDSERDRTINTLWREWASRGGGADVTGQQTIYGIEQVALRTMLESGEGFIRRIWEPDAEIPISLQLIESDQLAGDLDEHCGNDGNKVTQGIEMDRVGRRVAYWFYPEHPGDSGHQEPVRVPASDIIHIFMHLRPGQTRGVPWLAAVLRILDDASAYLEAELTRKRVEASFCVVVTEGETEDVLDTSTADDGLSGPTVVDADGNVVEDIHPGMIMYARGGRQITPIAPASVGGYADFCRVTLQAVAAGTGLSYELLGDLSKTNYTSLRAGLIEFRRLVEQMQELVLIPAFTQVWKWFVQAAWMRGLVPTSRIPVEWSTPQWVAVDPLAQIKADVMEIRNNLADWRDKATARGLNPDQFLADLADLNETIDGLGIVTDSDPRVQSAAGQYQAGIAPPESRTPLPDQPNPD